MRTGKQNIACYDIYRYQILPIDRYWTPDLLEPRIKSLDDLLVFKNEYFSDSLKTLPDKRDFEKSRVPLTCKLIYSDTTNQYYLFAFAAEKRIIIEKSDFKKETINNWPSFNVFIWNDPLKQYVLVQRRPEAFVNTGTVLKSIEESINIQLKAKNLKVHFEPLFEEKIFWDTVQSHEDQLKEVRFELLTPNMANISGALTDSLKELAKTTNSSKMVVSIISDDDSTLKLDKQNDSIVGMLDYASKGGGNIALRAKKIKRLIQTKNSKKHIEIEDLEIIVPGNATKLIDELKGQLL